MHLRAPSYDQGAHAFGWSVVFFLYMWLGALAIEVPAGHVAHRLARVSRARSSCSYARAAQARRASRARSCRTPARASACGRSARRRADRRSRGREPLRAGLARAPALRCARRAPSRRRGAWASRPRRPLLRRRRSCRRYRRQPGRARSLAGVKTTARSELEVHRPVVDAARGELGVECIDRLQGRGSSNTWSSTVTCLSFQNGMSTCSRDTRFTEILEHAGQRTATPKRSSLGCDQAQSTTA